MDQHYVPETYLRQFSIGRFLHQHLKNATYKSWEFRKVHVGKTCTENNFYDIENRNILQEFNIRDARYIENYGFGYENTLEKFLDTFRGHQQYLTRKDFIFLVETFVSMKHRTKAFRKQSANPETIKNSLEENVVSTKDIFINKFSHKYPTEMLAELYDQLIPKIKGDLEEKIYTSEFAAETHNHNILHGAHGINYTLNDVINKLLSMNFAVIEINSDGEFFLTSDNPGHTRSGLIIHGWHYGQFDSIFFPINSKQSIVFKGFNPVNYILGLRKINYLPADRLTIDDINYSTFRIADEKIYCENRQYLEYFIKERKVDIEKMILKRDGVLK